MTETWTVLSVRQPHADDLIYGRKRFENRTWATNYRGRLYIHASHGSDGESKHGPGVRGAIIGHVDLVECLSVDELNAMLAVLRYGEIGSRYQRLFGLSKSRCRELEEMESVLDVLDGMNIDDYTEHAVGPFCWVCTHPAIESPIPAKGRLNLWTFNLAAANV